VDARAYDVPSSGTAGAAFYGTGTPGTARIVIDEHRGVIVGTALAPATRSRYIMCQHQTPCPPAAAPDREAAHVVAAHPEQGWNLLCNGVVVFEDTGALLPDGQSIPPHRPAYLRVTARLRRPPRPATWDSCVTW
jgi:hypothetical protein